MVNEIVKKIITSKLDSGCKYSEESSLIDDFGFDSLTLFQILCELESNGYLLNESCLGTIKTVGDLIKSLKEK